MNSSVKSLAVVIVSGLLVTGLPVGAPPASSTGVSQLGGEIDGEAPGTKLGTAVSMSADGSRMAVGSPAHDSFKGHVRVFDWDGSEWTQVGPDIDGEVGDDELGTSVSLSNDGSRVAIGAPGHDSDRGHVRVYEYDSDNGAWDKLGEDIDGEEEGDKSGLSVSLSSDGSRVAIGAPLNDATDGVKTSSGLVRVYSWNGSAWTKLGSDIDGEEIGSKSGFAVSLSADGSRVAIGAPGSGNDARSGDDIDDTSVSGRGRVKVYDLIGTTWTQVGSNIDSDSGGAGTSVSLSADGSLVAVGIPFSAAVGASSTEEGIVRVYRNDGVTGDGDGVDGWTQLGSDMDGNIAQERFGFAVSLSADGSRVAIGAVRNDGKGGNLSHVGSVTVYDWNGSVWSQLGSGIDGQAANDEFGSSVALSSDGYRVAVGSGYRAAPGGFLDDPTGGSNANEGKVRAFSLPAAATPPAPAKNDDDDDDDDTVAAVEAPAPSAAERTPLPPGIADGAALRSSFRGGPPRNPRVSVGGVPAAVEKTFPNSQTLTVVAGGSFVLAVSVDEGSGGFASSNDDTQFIVKAGSTGVLQGYGLRPGASVKVSIPLSADESRDLGSITVGADGTFSGDLPISADPLAVPTPLGVHSLQLESVDPDGNQVVFEMAVTVTQGDPAPALDRASGLLPVFEPGSSKVTSAGVETEVTTTRLSDRGLDLPGDAPWSGITVFEALDWTMSVAERRYLSDIREEVRELRERYDPVEISGSGFVESTRADVWLFSEPILLGSVTVDDNGGFLVEVDIDPDVIPAGEHTLQIQGVGTDGYVKAVNLGVVVEQTVSQPAEVTTQSATGLLWWVLGLFLVALLVVLFFLMARSRSRQSA